MAKQASFAKGEIAPSLYARTDLAMYGIGLRTARNGFVAKQGGWYNRPGTTYINAVKDSSSKVRLIEFVFSDDDTYILEFGIGYIRFYRNGAQITVSSVTAWSSSTSYAIGDLASYGGVNYYCKVAHSNKVPPNTSYWYALTGDIFEIPNPFTTEDELAEFQFAQSNDVITIVHINHEAMELVRTGHTGWTLQDIVFGPTISAPTSGGASGGTFKYAAVMTYYVTSISANGEESLPRVITGPNGRIPSSTDPMYISWSSPGDEAISFKIYRSSSDQTIASGLIGETSNPIWFKDYNQDVEIETYLTYSKKPFDTHAKCSCVLYSQNRLLFACTADDASLVSASRIGLYKNFQTKYPIEDDGPISFSIVGNKANIIRSLAESRQLVALTSSSEWAINGDSAGILRPDSINAKQQSNRGAAFILPVTVGKNILYVQARGSIIRDLGYNFQDDGYDGPDLTIFSDHLFEGKTIVDWAYAQTPDSIVWVVLDDGTFLSLTYDKTQEMLAWTRHDTDGIVENVAVVPEGNEDVVYFVVRRTINGSTVRYIEKMATRVIDDIEDAVFMDSALNYDGTPVSTVSGLDHLEGEEVAVFADGFVIASPNNPGYTKITVSGGAISLGGSYSKVHVGLPYLSDLETLDIDSYAGEKKIVTNIRAYLEKSRSFWAGPSNPGDTDTTEGLTETELRTTEALGTPTALKTEEIDLNIGGAYGTGRVFVRNIDPTPLAILSVVPGGFMAQGGR